MALENPPGRRRPQFSIATRILGCVFAATTVTALAVSGSAIHSTHAMLRRQLDDALPDQLERAAEAVESWLVAAPPALGRTAAGAELGELRSRLDSDPDRRESLKSLLSNAAAETGARLRLLGISGRTLIGSAAYGEAPGPQPGDWQQPGVSSGALRESIDARGARWLVCARALETPGLTLVLELPYSRAFAPLLAAIARLFWLDALIILGMTAIAHRLAAHILQPIEALSQAALRIARGELDCEIPDPARADEIGRLARTLDDMLSTLRRNHLEIERANDRLTAQYTELLGANEVLAQLSITDGLTKLHNHRYFQDQLSRELKRVQRTGEPVSMLLVDLDDFKQLNDQRGHAAGDELLVRISQILSESVRESDLLARYGGEEFVVLAPDTNLDGARALAEKVRMAVCERRQIVGDDPLPVTVTVSIGVAQYRGSRKRFFGSTDSALYRAKAAGKNCVVTDAA